MLKYFFNREVDKKGNIIIPNPNLVLFKGGKTLSNDGKKIILKKSLIA